MSSPFAPAFRSFAILLMVGGLLAPSGRVQAQEDPAGGEKSELQIRLEQGIEMFNGGEYEAAAQAFTEIIGAVERAQAYSPAPYLYRAKAFAQLEEYEAAIEDLKNALTYAQGAPQLLPEIQNTRAEVYIEVGAYQLALPDLQAAAQADRSNPQYQFNLGKTLVTLGGAAAGEKSLTKYLDAGVEDEDEQRAEALQLRGLAYANLRKLDKAQEDFRASLDIDPTNHEVYFGRAQVALQEKEYAAAIKDLRLAIDNYTPEDEEDETPFFQGYLTSASAFEELGKEASDPAAAREAYLSGLAECETLLDLMPEDEPQYGAARAATLFRRGVLQRLAGEFGDAVKSFSQALQLNPMLGEAYFRRGICFHYMGEEKLAIRDFEQSASIDFASPRANLWKGMAWAKLGDFNESIRAYGQSIAVSDRYIPAYVNRGLAHLQQADYEKAIADFNEAIRLEPTNAVHYYRRGRAYALSGESDKAVQSLMNAIEFDKRLGPAYAAVATELDASGQSALASEYRRRASELGL